MLNIKNNITNLKTKRFNILPNSLNQLIINTILIFTITLALMGTYIIFQENHIILNPNRDFSELKIDKNKRIYVNKRLVPNNKKLNTILKNKYGITIKPTKNVNPNLFYSFYKKFRSLGFKNITFTRN